MGVRNLWSYNFARTKTLSDRRERLSDLEHNYLLCGRERVTLSDGAENIAFWGVIGHRAVLSDLGGYYRTFA